MAHAQPDGYSLLMGSTTTNVLITPLLANPPYDPVKDFSAVTVFAYSSTSIVIHPSVPAKTLQELIAYAKANPKKLSYGSAGNGSITNLAGELFKQRAGGLDIVHVPYKGIGQVVVDLVSGQIPMMSANATAHILDLHRTGKARILSVNSPTRLKTAPGHSDLDRSRSAGDAGPDHVRHFRAGGDAEAGYRPAERGDPAGDGRGAVPERTAQTGLRAAHRDRPRQAAGVFQDELVRWTPILKTVSTKPK